MYKIDNLLQLNTCENKIKYKNTSNNTINYDSNSIHEDIAKMHLLPLHCPMTPKSYKDFFNHDKHNTHEDSKRDLPGVSPYKLEKVKHPREGYKYIMKYNNFYTDWNKGALHYTSSNNEFIENQKYKPMILTDVNSENIKLYKDTKPHHEFASPMNMNGSNKVADLFDNCMNKKTFEYTRYSNISPHHKQWIDNPIFNGDISEETQHLKNNYMDDMEKDSMDIYSGVFEDMYYLSNDTNDSNNIYNTNEYNYLNKLGKNIDTEYKNNNFIKNNNIQKSKEENINKLNKELNNRNMLRSKNIKPNTKMFNNTKYNYHTNNYYNYDNNNNYNSNNNIKPENINYLDSKLDNQLNNSNKLLSKDLKQI